METVSAKILSLGPTMDGQTLHGNTLYMKVGIGFLHMHVIDVWAEGDLAEQLFDQLYAGWVVGLSYHPATNQIVGVSPLTDRHIG